MADLIVGKGSTVKLGGAATSPVCFVNRGDATAADFSVGSFTRDNAIHQLDLSAIVPAGAVAVFLRVIIQDTAAAKYIMFFPNGETHEYSIDYLNTQVANVPIGMTMGPIALDANRKISYQSNISNGQTLDVTVKGWFIPAT